MTPQESAWILTLVFVALCALIFLFAISGGGRFASAADEAKAARGWEMFRVLAFSGMVIMLIFVSFFTLVRFPIPAQGAQLDADQVIKVVGRQWSWQLSSSDVQAGKLIEFDVTSDDVNHGFAIYNEAGELVTQVQAMPEVTNRLLYTFPEPGTYHVLCLEYCGIGHPSMRTDIHVAEAAGQGVSK